MNWTELVERVAAKANVPRTQAHTVLTTFASEVSTTLCEGGEVRIQGVGTLARRWREPTTVRSVKDNRRLRIDGRFVPVFKPSDTLRARLVSSTPQTWRDPEQQAAWRLAETLIADLGLYHAAKAPKLGPDVPAAEVDRLCGESFGPLWARVRATYNGRISEPVRETFDYLAQAAISRFGAEAP